MRNPKVLIGTLLAIVVIGVGFVFRAPQPEVTLKADPLFHLGGLEVTNTLLTAYIVTVILSVVAFLATRRASLIPSGLYNAFEYAIEGMLNFVCDIAGEKNGRRFFPVIATIFLFVITCNYFGLLPIVNSIGTMHRQETGFVVQKQAGGIYTIDAGAKRVAEGDPLPAGVDQEGSSPQKMVAGFRPYLRSVNSDANSPLSIALWSFFFVEFWGLSSLGLRYIGKFLAFPPFTKGVSPISIFVGVLELLSELIRIISFTFRLFGNIFAGDVVILFMSFLAPFVIPVVFYGLETFVGFIQAAVFALLTLVFAISAVEHHGEGEHEAHGALPGEAAEVAAH